MELQYNALDNGIRLIKLTGKLDITATGQIETKFTAHCSGEKVRVIVDFSEVNFLSSIGIRLLIINAKSIAQRGGKMAIINPNPEVFNILDITGIPTIIPVFPDLDTAQTNLQIK